MVMIWSKLQKYFTIISYSPSVGISSCIIKQDSDATKAPLTLLILVTVASQISSNREGRLSLANASVLHSRVVFKVVRAVDQVEQYCQ
jgi:hypothetical protein